VVILNTDQPTQKHAGGAPPRYKTVEEMQTAIDRYFNETQSPVVTKAGVEWIPGPFTTTGLALALGFTSRQALINYEDKEEFVDAVTRAKLRVEAYNEGRLYDRDGVQGAKFSLSNNFAGWSERSEVNISGNILHQLQPPDEATLIAMHERIEQARQQRLAAENAITVEVLD
jgi:hypothetical protein